MKKDFIIPILVLTVICIVVAGALAAMNEVTAPIINAAAIERANIAMQEKLPMADGFEEIWNDNFPDSILEAYNSTNNVGQIFVATVTGFSGNITVMTAVDPNGQIIATSTLSHSETQGIGTIIEMPSFLDAFIGRNYPLEGVDAVAGATITTRAFIRAVDDILLAFEIARE